MAQNDLYKKISRDCVSEENVFACLSLWMEHCPLGLESLNEEIESLNEEIESDCGEEIDLHGSNGAITEEPLKKKPKVDDKRFALAGGNHLINDIEYRTTLPRELELLNESIKISDDQQSSSQTISTSNDIIRTSNNPSSGHGGVAKPNRTGVVVVDTDNRIVAMDCTRDGLHGVANALISNPEKARGCVVYSSRRPCSFCTKLLAQAKIQRIFYLPFEPENPDLEDLSQCARIHAVCSIAHSVFVPTISEQSVQSGFSKHSPFAAIKCDYKGISRKLMEHYWSNNWISSVKECLSWPEFDDLVAEVTTQVELMFDWMSCIIYCDVPSGTMFVPYNCTGSLKSERTKAESRQGLENEDNFCPDVADSNWQDLALHMIRIAHMLAQPSDDPTRGVGAVILKENDIVAASWNGYISGSRYGDFPRAATKDAQASAKKYPFSIHGEQRAILNRFCPDIKHKSTTLFVNKMPCDECVPLLLKVGIKNVVFPPESVKKGFTPYLKPKILKRTIVNGKLNGFVSEHSCNLDSAHKQACHIAQLNGVVKEAKQIQEKHSV